LCYFFQMLVTLLGTGTSFGVPIIACDCPTCTSTDPRDRRTRTGVHIDHEGHGLLIDTPPELRLQCIAHGIRRVNAVFYTHAHADHIMGLDDLRRFNWIHRAPIPCFGNQETLDVLKQVFAYAVADNPDNPSYTPDLRLECIESPRDFHGLEIIPVPLFHGDLPVLGYRIGPFAFLTDCNHIPDTSLALLEDLDMLVLDALRPSPHPTHFSLPEAVEMAGKIGARRTCFTHMTHEVKHAETSARLPEGMELAYDGQRFLFNL